MIFMVLLIQLFPYVRNLLPQRDEDWLFKVTKEHSNLVKLIHQELSDHNPYYQALSPEGKKKFIRRVLYLILRKTIVGYHGQSVDFPMAIMVLGAQVQLTYGMKRFSLPHFKKILIYPREFYSNYFEQNVKGLTSGLGFINLSWHHSKEGYEHPEDNLNLLLHEFAHALLIELKIQKDVDRQILRSFEKHGEKAVSVFQHIRAKGNATHPYLRDYGFTNKHEFFAVCVEHFFETPRQFKKEMKKLYSLYCLLLNQDPLNSKNDYILS